MSEYPRSERTSVTVRDGESGSLLDLGFEQLAAEAERVHRVVELATAEAKLSLHSVGVLGAALLIGAVLALGAWGATIAAATALVLRLTDLPLEAVLAGVAALHLVALIGVALVMQRADRSIGFPETKRQLRRGA
jgi:predicted phage tail protein